ncbi:MAG TPA: metal-dependent hydrolase [Microbacterium sp.]|nr:metal-dependent hydrolase [Microbacterium sp.]
MMGTSHAVSGAAAWIAVTATTLPALGLHPLTPGAVLLGAGVCAGAALLPDADHHSATIAHSVPVLGQAVADTVETVSGGHRHGMHSLLAVAGTLAATFGLGMLRWTPAGWDHSLQVGSALAVMACTAFALKVLTLFRSWLPAWLVGAVVAGGILLWAPEQFGWLPLCTGLGFAVHLVGDALTVEGVPLLWPLNPRPPALLAEMPVLRAMWKRNGYLAVPVLGHAGSVREWLLMLLLATYAVWGIASAAMLLVGWRA